MNQFIKTVMLFMMNRLFVRVINEYTSTPSKNLTDEQAISENAFTLIFAFDEIVALGES